MTLPPPLYPVPSAEPVPTLTAEIVADDDELGIVVDAFVHLNHPARVRQWEVGCIQACIRDAVDAEAWGLVMQMEETMNARWADVIVLLARWAFTEGVRAGRAQR